MKKENLEFQLLEAIITISKSEPSNYNNIVRFCFELLNKINIYSYLFDAIYIDMYKLVEKIAYNKIEPNAVYKCAIELLTMYNTLYVYTKCRRISKVNITRRLIELIEDIEISFPSGNNMQTVAFSYPMNDIDSAYNILLEIMNIFSEIGLRTMYTNDVLKDIVVSSIHNKNYWICLDLFDKNQDIEFV